MKYTILMYPYGWLVGWLHPMNSPLFINPITKHNPNLR